MILLLMFTSIVWAQQSVGEPNSGSSGPNSLKNVYFGEEHLHTSASPDAFVVGTRGTWEDAYRYAMGAEVTLSVVHTQAVISGVFELIERRGLVLEDLRTHRPTLEDVFVSLTGKHLRDA